MMRTVRPFTFRSIGKYHCDWHFELNDKGKYWDWLWLDGWTEQGYWYGLTLAWRMEMLEHRIGYEKKDWPIIDLLITNPEGKTHRVLQAFPREQFKVEEPWGCTIGDNYLKGTSDKDGNPTGYRVKVAMDGAGIDVTCKGVAPGMRFVDEEHGYTFYRPKENLAVGWWPLLSSSEMAGTMTYQGQTANIKGLSYVERQLGNVMFWGLMPHWSYGHFFAGDYTAVWIDNTSAGPGYRHFSPFVLFKGQHPILSTHNLNLHMEKFVLDKEHGNMPYPPIETLHATEGHTELTSQTEPGHIVAWEYVTELPGTDVSAANPVGYHRQYGPINVQIRRWDKVEQIRGVVLREFDWMTEWFPFPRK
jgi:hypothetical protein